MVWKLQQMDYDISKWTVMRRLKEIEGYYRLEFSKNLFENGIPTAIFMTGNLGYTVLEGGSLAEKGSSNNFVCSDWILESRRWWWYLVIYQLWNLSICPLEIFLPVTSNKSLNIFFNSSLSIPCFVVGEPEEDIFLFRPVIYLEFHNGFLWPFLRSL